LYVSVQNHLIFVGCSRSILEVKQNKYMLMALVARAAEFDGLAVTPSPLGRGVLEWGIAGHSQIKGLFFKWIQRRDPLPLNPHRQGGEDPLRRIKSTDATNRGVPSFEPSQRANQLQSCEEIAGGLFVASGYASELFDELRESFG
jgi:hypothetical protein